MNLEDLRAAQVDERGADSLQPLPSTFYEDAAAYLADLRERRDRLAGQVDDPFESAEVRQLTDELETATEVVEALYERRMGKVVKRASLAAAGMPTDDEGLTAEEQVLFADLVDRIEQNRAAVLETLDADARGDPDPATDEGSPAAVADDPARPDEAESDPQPEPSASEPGQDPEEVDEALPDDPDRVTVRITADVGEIYGVDDRVYTLGDEDVVSLPSANAEPLIDRGAAQRLEER